MIEQKQGERPGQESKLHQLKMEACDTLQFVFQMLRVFYHRAVYGGLVYSYKEEMCTAICGYM